MYTLHARFSFSILKCANANVADKKAANYHQGVLFKSISYHAYFVHLVILQVAVTVLPKPTGPPACQTCPL